MIRVWTRPAKAPPGWRIPRAEVHEAVAWAFDHYRVGLMLCDPAKWHTEIEGWAQSYGDDRVIFFDTNSLVRMARACDRWLTALAEGAYSHDGDAVTTDHVLAMHRTKVHVRDADDDGGTKYVFVKGPDRRKIDAGIADVLALQAAATMPDEDQAADPWAVYA
ncbi:hypothetical protein EV192_109131 [Actinocrispum wychmicini]|uniref:Phage terminase large subunit-like protein n=1 Tax=Actinocrispum wychmicini TaxID=1213861 RepID=A0A4R2J5I8_9PSEU|nr:hypothetical protein EV192_109131 [Actinocrispum wychmicini]